MSEQQKHFPEFYVTAPQPCPYLPGRLERKLFTHLTHEKPSALIDNLLKGGFRRSQNIAYMPYCEGCHACVSVRVLVDEFQPNRSMRKAMERNRDLVARRIAPSPTPEQYALFRDYIDARHFDGGMADMTVLDYAAMVEETAVDTMIVEYLSRGEDGEERLIACALTDRLTDGLSMVYSFFEPEEARRSLGQFMILDHVALAREFSLPYIYLGYWVEGSGKMDYKRSFQPLERLTASGWVRMDRTS